MQLTLDRLRLGLKINFLQKSYLFGKQPAVSLVVIYCLFVKCLSIDGKERHVYKRFNVATPKTAYSDDKHNFDPASKPAFDPITAVNVTATKGHQAHLACKINNLGSNMVSWVKYNKHLHILSVGKNMVVPDARFSLSHSGGTSDWTLRINSVKLGDAGKYECQIGTSPKLSRNITLYVFNSTNGIRGNGAPSVLPRSQFISIFLAALIPIVVKTLRICTGLGLQIL